jgi:hypothetical protein
MDDKKRRPEEPEPKRIEALRNLPPEVVETLTKEEIDAFLFDDLWPDSLREKLKDYLTG